MVKEGKSLGAQLFPTGGEAPPRTTILSQREGFLDVNYTVGVLAQERE